LLSKIEIKNANYRVEQIGYAMDNAARFFKSVVLLRMFRDKNAIRTRNRWANK
jgi:hypothetical protein